MLSDAKFEPASRTIYAVRWARDRGDVGTKFYIREASARAYAKKLITTFGKDVAIMALTGTWEMLGRKHRKEAA